MNFKCTDLDEALRAPELPEDAVIHAQTCDPCRKQIELWSSISDFAPQLHEEWSSPALWNRIECRLEVPPRNTGSTAWRVVLAAAASLLMAVGVYCFWPTHLVTSSIEPGAFLTAQTLKEVQSAETTYVQAIEKLSAAAGPTLKNSSTPLAAMYREKLSLLDSAIADLKAGVAGNRYNAYLQMQLATLYQEKQKTLEEWLENAKHNN